jgi:hypothetical protein
MSVFGQFQQEAAVVGRLLAGYGELEFELKSSLRFVIGDMDTATRVVFRTRGEEQRIITADAIMRPRYDAVGSIPTRKRSPIWDGVAKSVISTLTAIGYPSVVDWDFLI